jgi:hypothetical protein
VKNNSSKYELKQRYTASVCGTEAAMEGQPTNFLAHCNLPKYFAKESISIIKDRSYSYDMYIIIQDDTGGVTATYAAHF